ncbi:unnamed protein product [Prorocentrum cordatum]|uniref:Uncharacterized protein n=1 Tax=Prorocentrum cordatum TaxID=2364126 RepID=A0ABN9TIP5_9DINO|nr:unnamed protein product [Polarella glacialis]
MDIDQMMAAVANEEPAGPNNVRGSAMARSHARMMRAHRGRGEGVSEVTIFQVDVIILTTVAEDIFGCGSEIDEEAEEIPDGAIPSNDAAVKEAPSAMPETVYGVVLANTKKISVVLTEEGKLLCDVSALTNPWSESVASQRDPLMEKKPWGCQALFYIAYFECSLDEFEHADVCEHSEDIMAHANVVSVIHESYLPCDVFKEWMAHANECAVQFMIESEEGIVVDGSDSEDPSGAEVQCSQAEVA